MALGPAGIEAQEHLRPIAGFGATGARLNLEEGVAGVLRTAKHGPQFKIIQPPLGAAQLRLQLGLQAGIFLRQLTQGLQIAARCLQLLKRLEQRVELLELLDRLLGFVGVVPEGRPAHQIVQLGALTVFAGDVKDCPGAA